MKVSPTAALLLAALAIVHNAQAYNNGPMALKPPLGWQTWCSVGPCGTDHCFDGQIRETAKAMVDNGMKDLGYEWIILDDCWHPSRASNGTLVPFPDFFPNGMQPVIDYVHSLGLKFGLYTSVGTRTCHGGWSPGSFGHYQTDADTFASWKVDYVKVDYCGGLDSPQGHKLLSEALNKTGRPMVLELCRGPYQEQDHWGYAPSIAQVWRASSDHHDDFNSTLGEVAAFKGRSTWSGSYGWAYGDMLMTGGEGCDNYDWHKPNHCPKQTDNEYRTEFSLYSILSSPLMVGTDIRNVTDIMKEVLFNPEVIAVNQDHEAVPGDQVTSCGHTVWLRKLSNGDFAVVAPNLGLSRAPVTLCFGDLGWKDSKAHVRDLWARKDAGTFTDKFTATVDTHDSLFVILSKTD